MLKEIINGFNKTIFGVIMKLHEICSSITVGINKFNDAQDENLIQVSLLTGQSLNDKGFLDVDTRTTKTVFVDEELIEKKKVTLFFYQRAQIYELQL